MGKKKTLERFLFEAKTINPELDLSLVDEYVNNSTKIKVICHKKDCIGREHGIFEVTPLNLLSGKSCPKCSGKGFTSDDRKLFCLHKYDNKYDYSKSDFSDVKKKTIVGCSIHGDFLIDYDHHFNSNVGCPYCSCSVRDTESFKKEALRVHNGKYSYENVDYENSHKKVSITCPIHGEFLQTPNAHLKGQGCPKCANGRLILEEKINNLLSNNKIGFIHNKRPQWLKRNLNGQLSIDFFIPTLQLGIECQGKQHFGLGGWNNGYNFQSQFERDKWKFDQCAKNNVKLVYFANKNEAPNEYIGKIFTNEDELMKYIRYLYKENNNKN